VQARLHQGMGGTHVWVTNPTRTVKKVTVTLGADVGDFKSAEDRWGGVAVSMSGQQLTMSVPARDAVVAVLR
jgi:beta-galactosidase